eukprot:SAG31_NODE_21502_length_548_cov_0.679287_2_plen_73_part_01
MDASRGDRVGVPFFLSFFPSVVVAASPQEYVQSTKFSRPYSCTGTRRPTKFSAYSCTALITKFTYDRYSLVPE